MANKLRFTPPFLAAFLFLGLCMAPALSAETVEAESAGTGAGPQIVSPAGRIVIPGNMKIITAKGPNDHLISELEVWRVSGGKPVLKVWQARLESGGLTTATLTDGSFVAGINSLDPWARYAIRF